MTEAENRSVEQLTKEDNELLLWLLRLRAQRGSGWPAAKTYVEGEHQMTALIV
jgi:ribosomal protein L29